MRIKAANFTRPVKTIDEIVQNEKKSRKDIKKLTAHLELCAREDTELIEYLLKCDGKAQLVGAEDLFARIELQLSRLKVAASGSLKLKQSELEHSEKSVERTSSSHDLSRKDKDALNITEKDGRLIISPGNARRRSSSMTDITKDEIKKVFETTKLDKKVESKSKLIRFTSKSKEVKQPKEKKEKKTKIKKDSSQESSKSIDGKSDIIATVVTIPSSPETKPASLETSRRRKRHSELKIFVQDIDKPKEARLERSRTYEPKEKLDHIIEKSTEEEKGKGNLQANIPVNIPIEPVNIPASVSEPKIEKEKISEILAKKTRRKKIMKLKRK